MLITVILALIMMAGLFLMLWAAVGFIQDKKFFSSAPKEELEVLLPKEERFPGAHLVGWCMMIAALIMIGGPVVFGAWDGIRNAFSFWQFFGRFVFMLLALKAFDIMFFDYFLLCRSRFFIHYYPEVEPVLGPHLFGYNWKSHLAQILLMIAGSLIFAWICTLF